MTFDEGASFIYESGGGMQVLGSLTTLVIFIRYGNAYNIALLQNLAVHFINVALAECGVVSYNEVVTNVH